MIYIMFQNDKPMHDLYDEHVGEYVYGYDFSSSCVITEMD